MGMLQEFKDFAIKGNMIDLAVGFIMGGAFGTVIKSLVTDVIMPPIGYLMGGVNFSEFGLTLVERTKEQGGNVAINYGSFIDNLISFVILAFCVFLLIKAVNRVKERFEKEKEEAAAAAPPKSETLLEEIRDALRK